MDNLDKAKLESYIDGLCGGNYTPAGNSFIIDTNMDKSNLESAFANEEKDITLLPLETKTSASPFGRTLIESIETATTYDDLENIAKALSEISDMEIEKINNNKIKLFMTNWNEKSDKDVRNYLRLHPEVKSNIYQDEIEISLK